MPIIRYTFKSCRAEKVRKAKPGPFTDNSNCSCETTIAAEPDCVGHSAVRVLKQDIHCFYGIRDIFNKVRLVKVRSARICDRFAQSFEDIYRRNQSIYIHIYERHAIGTKYGDGQAKFPIMTRSSGRFNVVRSRLQIFRSLALYSRNIDSSTKESTCT